MLPVSPVLPEFVGSEEVIAKDQPEYIPLPVLRGSADHPAGKTGALLSRWRLTEQEREAIAEGADLMVTVLTFGSPLQPMILEVSGCPVDAAHLAERMGLKL